jgi:hypothetical protein
MRGGLLQVKDYIEKFVLKTESVKILYQRRLRESHNPRVNDEFSTKGSIANVRKGIFQPHVVPPSLLIDAFM